MKIREVTPEEAGNLLDWITFIAVEQTRAAIKAK
jgi:hypothetical protein